MIYYYLSPGFDATASSLHVGSLLQIMILRNLQKAGHKPVILIGGGTTKVGDPSGKDESRQLLTEETIASNANSISQIFRKYITFEGIIITTTTTTSTTTLPLLILLKVIIVSRKLAMLLWLITPIGLITLII